MDTALSIGIDLGTSNCALAVVTVHVGDSAATPRIVPVVQPEEGGSTLSADLLPSFLYHPRPDERTSLGSAPVPGHLARRAASRTPGRVTHAAKSWLSHRLVDRNRPILPWGSTEVPETERVSPVSASVLLLRQLWAAAQPWIPANAPDTPVILTVPASFAPDAQELTLAAAREAGLPPQVRLLEEPQAVFYDWLARHGGPAGLDDWLKTFSSVTQASGLKSQVSPSSPPPPLHLLVCDLGGGTSDFSLFTARPATQVSGLNSRISSVSLPRLERIAVGEHLLLGGDNIDAALAHFIEEKLGGTPDPRAWPGLVAAARDAKEAILSRASDDNTPHTVAVTRPGGGLFASTRSITLAPADMRALVLDGFFPECPADATPARPAGGLRELGLPFATDSAITRHLAGFLRGRRVDAVLYNGGTLAPDFLRERITRLLATWQGHPVVELDNPRPDQAVALGAAWFGAQLRRGTPLIASHAAHSFWIETGTTRSTQASSPKPQPSSEPQVSGFKSQVSSAPLLCVLPHGTPLDQPVRVAPPGLLARVNQPIAFRLYSSARPADERPGDLRTAGPDHTALPELTAFLQIPPGAPRPANGVLPVALEATINAVGLLRVRCLPLQPLAGYPEAWDLHFPLRPTAASKPQVSSLKPQVPDLAPALAAIDAAFASKPPASEPQVSGLKSQVSPPVPQVSTPRTLFADIERLLDKPRADWTPDILRGLWPALAATLTRRQRSPEHEATWLSLAGYCLRPGCGWPHDDTRLNELWRVRELGLAFPRDPRVQTQEWILWRRVAGGLDAARQATLWKRWENPLRSPDVPPELIRAAATLERLAHDTRRQLVRRLLDRLPRLVSLKPGQLEAWLWALGRLCSRCSLSGDPAAVLPPDILPDLLAVLAPLKFGQHTPVACAALAQAFRRTGERTLDAAPEAQATALELLTRWQATPAQLDRVRDLVPEDEAADLQALAGDRLPAGLIFSRKK
jgi:molecular chaperone DnaK (HSP70)